MSILPAEDHSCLELLMIVTRLPTQETIISHYSAVNLCTLSALFTGRAAAHQSCHWDDVNLLFCVILIGKFLRQLYSLYMIGFWQHGGFFKTW